MESWRRNLWLLWIGALVVSASYTMVVPFLPLFLLSIGVHRHVELWSAILFSAAFVAGACISPYWGSLADRYGRKPMLIRSGFTLFLVYFLTAFVHNPYELLALRLAQGLLSGFIPSAIALVGTHTPEQKVGYALATMSTATATGGIVGPLLGGAISHWLSNRIAFASAGVFVLLATIMVLLFVKEENFVPKQHRSSVWSDLGSAARNRTLVCVLCLTVLTSFSVMTIEPVLPLYIAQLGGSVQNASLLAGIVFSLSGVASILFAPRWGKLSDRAGFGLVLLIGLAGGGIGNLAQIPFHGVWGFSVVRFLYGAFFCAVYPSLNGLVVRSTDPDFRGRAFSLNQTANQVGTVLGPMVGGTAAGWFGVHGVFVLTGGLLLATLACAYWMVGRRPWAAVRRQTAAQQARQA
ncbi:MAG: MFS transporter [Alicyclobacillaceae bacterium]|nr:MFS transporter [Alicyclobacillaceae bacterium]